MIVFRLPHKWSGDGSSPKDQSRVNPQLLPAHGLPASRKNAGQPFQAANIFAHVHYDAAFVCFQAAFGLHRKRQPETFAKPVTDSPSAARRHLANQQSPLNTHLATSRRRSIAHLIFRLPLSTQRQPETPFPCYKNISGCLMEQTQRQPENIR